MNEIIVWAVAIGIVVLSSGASIAMILYATTRRDQSVKVPKRHSPVTPEEELAKNLNDDLAKLRQHRFGRSMQPVVRARR